MNQSNKIFIVFISLLLASFLLQAQDESEATCKLKARNEEFRPDIIPITDNVYTAVGYSVSNVSMIIGETGLVIVDAGLKPADAEKILAEFRKITDKPVKAIIYTHGHGDHTGGASVFAGEGEPEIWARSGHFLEQEGFNLETRTLDEAGLTINGKRGVRQAGLTLPDEWHINNGVAPVPSAKADKNANPAADEGLIEPSHTFDTNRVSLDIGGIQLDLVAATGETYDELYVWLPKEKVVFTGDNFYKSFPNLYTIRGAPYRDVQDWYRSIDQMLQEGPKHVVPGHTRPIIGERETSLALINYRDAIRFVFDKTIEGMNMGMTPDELVAYVQLPDSLANKDYLEEYYGAVAWSVRSIFHGYLGWFDGNPINLDPLAPKEEAQRMVTLVGGEDKLLATAQQALDEQDYQWAATLTDYLLALDPNAAEPKLIKADALIGIAENMLTATGRNYTLSYALELKEEAEASSKK
ncbi:MAG: alkyl/aryl-sulfatase [Cyclobacteriaceae bacterium]